MKNIFKTTVICLGAFALTACNDWLDTKTDSQLPESVTFNNIEDIQSATIGLYADLCSDPYNQLQTIHQGTGTDCELIDGFGADAEGGENERAGMNYNAVPGWAKIGTLWEKQYKTIEDCNRIIEGVANSDLKDNDAVMIATAEARVIRAMVYLDLVRVFGDIPLRWDAAKADGSNIKQGKTDRDIILDKLIEDLEGVVEENKLPWCGETTQEHVNMGYAKGLLANIYMTRAGYAIREDDNTYAEEGGYSSSKKENAQDYAKTYAEDGVKRKYEPATYTDPKFKTLRPSKEDCDVLYKKAEEHLKDIIDNGTHDMNPTFAGFWGYINKLELDPTHESMFEIPMGLGLTGELGYTVGVRMNEVTKDFGFTNSSGKIKTTAVQFYSYQPFDTRRDITCATFSIRSIDRRNFTKSNMTVTKATMPDYDKNSKDIHLPEGCVAIDKSEVPDDIDIEVRTETGSDVTAERHLGNAPFELYIGKWDVRRMSDRWKQQNLVSSLKFGYGINVVRMRYPQILLWYAECLAWRGDFGNAATYVTKVHNRAFYDAPDENYQKDEAQTSKENDMKVFKEKAEGATDINSFIEVLDLENSLEFCGEGFRKWDLIRWNRLHDDIVAAKKKYISNFNDNIFQEKVYFKYKGYTAAKDADGKIFYWAPEKEIDLNSVTWYGENGTNAKAATNEKGETKKLENRDFFNNNQYRYANSDPEKYTYLGLGKENKDMNNRSYANNAYGGAYDKLDNYLPSICSGLVGKCDVSTGECDDSELDVKNCYLMPIGTLVLQSSNRRLYNSYKWGEK